MLPMKPAIPQAVARASEPASAAGVSLRRIANAAGHEADRERPKKQAVPNAQEEQRPRCDTQYLLVPPDVAGRGEVAVRDQDGVEGAGGGAGDGVEAGDAELLQRAPDADLVGALEAAAGEDQGERAWSSGRRARATP